MGKVTFLQSSPAPIKNHKYVFDSNVWLPILGFDGEEYENYKIFFSKVVKEESNRILMCPLQVSELFNRLLRFHAYKQHEKISGSKPKFDEYYKTIYRQSSVFLNYFESVQDDFLGYSGKIDIVDASLQSLEELLDFKGANIDLNDHYLYLLTQQKNATLVTADGDFSHLDIDIATYNRKLYRAYKDSILPKKSK